MASGPIISWQTDGERTETMADFIFLGSQITAAVMLAFGKSYDKSRQHSKKQRHNLVDKTLYSQNYGFSRSHVWM